MLRTLITSTLACIALAGLAGCHKKDEPRAPVATAGNPEQGRRLIVQFGCASCHTVPGVRAERGLVGPPLAGIARRAVIGGSLPNTPDNMAQWIMHPRQFSPNSAMPDLGVSLQQAQDITAYLYREHD